MASPFYWPVLVPCALRAPAPVNLGVRRRQTPMSLRSIIRLIAFAASVSIGIAGLYIMKAENWAGLLVGFACVVVAACGVVVSVFRIPVFGKAYPDSGFGVLSESQGNALGSILVFLLGALVLFLAARGVYRGVVPVLGSGPDVTFAQAPLDYLLSCAVWFGGGGGLVWLSWKVMPHRKARGSRTRGRGKSSDA